MADTKISALTGKTTPIAADTSVIVDSADGLNKSILLGNLPLTGNRELKALATGLLKNTTTTGTPSIAVAADLPSGIDATKIADGSVTNTEFQYIGTLTDNAQTQLNTYGSQVTTGVNPGHGHAVKAIATGTDTLTATFTPSLPLKPLDATRAADGTMVVLVAAGANTGAVTFAPDSITVKAVKKITGLALGAGDIPAAGYQCHLVYDLAADVWYLLNPGAATQMVLTPGVADHAYSGIYFPATAGENVGIGDVCYLKSDGKYWIAKADVATTKMPGIVMAAAAISTNATGLFLSQGFLRDDSWGGWTVGVDLFITITGTTGNTVSATAPSASGNIVQKIGYAYGAKTIFFNPNQTAVTVP